jgi:hypothetical protein
MLHPRLLWPLSEHDSPAAAHQVEDQDSERRSRKAYRECLVSHVFPITITEPAVVTAVRTSVLLSAPGLSWTAALSRG